MPEAWTFGALLDDMARRDQAPALMAVRATILTKLRSLRMSA